MGYRHYIQDFDIFFADHVDYRVMIEMRLMDFSVMQ